MNKTYRNNQPNSRLDECRAKLGRRCDALGIRLPESQLDGLAGYLDLLQQWQRHLNLTGLREIDQLIDVLILESLDFLQGPYLSGSQRVLDLGTGAGVPGLPLAICQPQLEMTLLDRSQKKMIFVRRVISRLKLHHCRAETDAAEGFSRRLSPSIPGAAPDACFDAVVTRGVGTVSRLLTLAEPLLRPGGVLLLRKPPQTPELDAAAPELASGRWRTVETFPLRPTGVLSWTLLAIVKQTPEAPKPARGKGAEPG